MKEDFIVDEVTINEDSISIESGKTGFGLSLKYGVIPKVGDTITLHTTDVTQIIGMDLNGKQIFRKTDGEKLPS